MKSRKNSNFQQANSVRIYEISCILERKKNKFRIRRKERFKIVKEETLKEKSCQILYAKSNPKITCLSWWCYQSARFHLQLVFHDRIISCIILTHNLIFYNNIILLFKPHKYLVFHDGVYIFSDLVLYSRVLLFQISISISLLKYLLEAVL